MPLIQKLIEGKAQLMEAYESVAQVSRDIDTEIRAAWARGEDANRGTMTAETKARFDALHEMQAEADQQYERLNLEFYRDVDRWLAEAIYADRRF